MATVADLISDALKILGVIAAGETLSSEDQSDAFRALNRMMDSWANERLALFATSRDTYTLTSGHNPHTLGNEGSPDFNATRPLRIDRASIVLASSGNSELPLNILSDEEWQITQGKVTTGLPAKLWIETKFPLIKLWLNPIPVNADTLVLYTWQQLGRFASTSTTFDMPPGYEEAIVYNLALRCAPLFGETLSQEAMLIASNSFASIKRTNTKPMFIGSDPSLLRRGSFNVIAGDRG